MFCIQSEYLGLNLNSCYIQKSTKFGFSSVLFINSFPCKRSISVCMLCGFFFISGLTVATILFGIIRSLLVFQVLVNSGQNLHNKMFQSILKAPVLFFDRNPIGKVNSKKPLNT